MNLMATSKAGGRWIERVIAMDAEACVIRLGYSARCPHCGAMKEVWEYGAGRLPDFVQCSHCWLVSEVEDADDALCDDANDRARDDFNRLRRRVLAGEIDDASAALKLAMLQAKKDKKD